MARTAGSPIAMRLGVWLIAAAVALLPHAASACPVCHTETGKEVRAGIFNEQFAENVVLTLMPFPLLIGIVAAIHFGLPPIPFRTRKD